MYGSQLSILPFLSRHSRLLNGIRTRVVLGMKQWGVRGEGWRVLVESADVAPASSSETPSSVVRELTSTRARAADLPAYLSR